MEDRTVPDGFPTWEHLLNPGVSWIVWTFEDRLGFCLLQGESSLTSSKGCMEIEKVFPPDIAFLLHEIVRDATEMVPGEAKRVALAIPGTDTGWPCMIFRLDTDHFTLSWLNGGNGDQEKDFCDLREHLRNEKAIRKANEKLNYFNAIVRHDIMNLMMGINGYMDIIDEIVDDEEIHLLIRKSRDLGERVRRVAELTRTYQDLGNRPPAYVEVAPVMEKIFERHEFSGKIITDVQVNGLFVYVDRMFDAAIYEIVKNALQYGGEGVKIKVFALKVPEGMALIIMDSGPGVHPDFKERIFSRTYEDRRGYGLYLALEILDITGAAIRETGTHGEGARFELIFPPDAYRFGP
ncbi:HAMP domain-containing sensor histidine kinase [Methanospirillum sp.]|jgi:signal transduction histidine kinase|uniref:sensor histidine kinase n=1 Tax=Methanospirillum sp. TaxID=45200 RepID=UPI001BD322A8|nr:HAMP domain-containing sensor histidine kinase [Methanospirillum sp.]